MNVVINYLSINQQIKKSNKINYFPNLRKQRRNDGKIQNMIN